MNNKRFFVNLIGMYLARIILALFIALLPVRVSALDDSALTLLADAEKTYYDLSFNYAMDTVKPDGKYSWSSYSGNGTLTLSDSYVSKSGATCRNFAEIFTVQGVAGDNEGVGCKRVGKEGWCKLKMNDALTCAMEPSKNVVEDKMRDAHEYFSGKEGAVNGIRQMLP